MAAYDNTYEPTFADVNLWMASGYNPTEQLAAMAAFIADEANADHRLVHVNIDCYDPTIPAPPESSVSGRWCDIVLVWTNGA